MNATRQTADPIGLDSQAIALAILIQVVWAVSNVLGKVVVDQFPPLLFQGLRFFILALILLPFMCWHTGRWKPIVIVALGAGAAHFGFMFLGLKLADDITPVLIAVQLSAPFAVLFSILLLGERVGVKRMAGLALAFAGVAILGFDPRVFVYIDALGVVLLAAIAWGFAAVYMRQLKDIGVFDMQGWTAWGAFPVLLAASLVFENPLDAVLNASWTVWAVVGYTVFAATLIGHAGLFWLIQRYTLATLAPWIMLAPVLGSILGVIWLGDVVTWRMVVGGLLTLSGVLIVNIRTAVQESA